jgi:hypothetical protein
MAPSAKQRFSGHKSSSGREKQSKGNAQRSNDAIYALPASQQAGTRKRRRAPSSVFIHDSQELRSEDNERLSDDDNCGQRQDEATFDDGNENSEDSSDEPDESVASDADTIRAGRSAPTRSKQAANLAIRPSIQVLNDRNHQMQRKKVCFESLGRRYVLTKP